ncbi:uncharacterized protein LOC110422438 isoform X3 [Herrania umbratica]|uniref:Uncharacterized protein LOC110422438 isoform X3 n=1 Tax=Herrania umbratica TaxID=108875 RepID=A0A6J1AYF6_9ROSI|nr:uncharacterized protein LOC110422438 isoform X3 [Herrania umbratica]XP_021292020.1 uncharacterized protein LOC110422438 isoform X3 [Herrania umbratica]
MKSFIVLMRARRLPFKESVRWHIHVEGDQNFICHSWVTKTENHKKLSDQKDDAPVAFNVNVPYDKYGDVECQLILLTARSIYPNLSKLALALEKNLLVTSTLTVCTNPYPQMMRNPEPEKASEEAQPRSDPIQNGVEPVVGDRDEVMTEVEEADIEDMTIDMDAFQEMVGSSEANSTVAGNS